MPKEGFLDRGIVICCIVIALLSMPAVIALKNPAAVYCTELGYSYGTELVDGAMQTRCTLPDGSAVSGWDFLKGKEGKGFSYCVNEGYDIRTVRGSGCRNIYSSECAVCVLEDGSMVEVTELMGLSFIEGVCGDGICGVPEDASSCPDDCADLDDGLCDGMSDGVCDPDCTAQRDPDCSAHGLSLTFYVVIGVFAFWQSFGS